MFDFAGTLREAEEAVKNQDFAMATFYYWLIGFAYEDEEFPYSYTDDIGKKLALPKLFCLKYSISLFASVSVFVTIFTKCL